MVNFKRVSFIGFLSICILFFVLSPLFTENKNRQFVSKPDNLKFAVTPTPFNPFPYIPPTISNSRSYLTMLVGDSIVGSLGPNANTLREHLIKFYPNHEFVNYNYGFGATNIETLPKRLNEYTDYEGQNFQPILSQGFDLIIIESFAYNPLSHIDRLVAVEKHIQILDESVRWVIKEKPNSVVALMTPIAPNKKMFATGVYDLSSEERVLWVEERLTYVDAVIEYAKQSGIPLINVYENSLNNEGDGDLKYINPDDYIHPSHKGVDLISQTIAEFIYTNNIFPE